MISVAKKPLRVFSPDHDCDLPAETSRTADGCPVSAAPVLRTFVEPSASSTKSVVPAVNFSLAQARLDANEPIVPPEGNLALTYRLAKRTLDVTGSAALIVMLSPILITVFVILSITTKGRPIIRQQRVGHLGRRFPMFKFRSMRLDAEKLQHLVRNEKDGPIFKNRHDPRITCIGRILRRTSIDEMPQLFNVLAGHMSLVGPRPPLAKEVAQYKPWQRRRLAIKPGLTCLWQISGRCEIGFDQWVRMDIWYANNQNLWTDLKLLVRTPLSVISCRGAY
jgi:lipopolysaccharide/colanic/teichoic acid biosynthesis glycosyltransferase